MKESVRFLVLVLVCLAALACSSTTPQPEPTPMPSPTPSAMVTPTPPAETAVTPPSDMAMVYIYRPKAFVGWALRPTVMLDGKDLINVKNGSVWSHAFTPGHYVFQMDDKGSGAELDLKAGESYYMKVEIVPGFWKGGGKMTLMAKEQGALEVKTLPPLPKDEVEHVAYKN